MKTFSLRNEINFVCIKKLMLCQGQQVSYGCVVKMNNNPYNFQAPHPTDAQNQFFVAIMLGRSKHSF